jgi:uncharacterized membrane protein
VFSLKVLKKIPSLITRDGIFLFLAIAVFIATFGLIALMKYFQFGYNGLDLAIINQSFYLTLHGDIFGSTIHPPSYWADHFSPAIFLLLPFYFFWPQPTTLLLMQVIVIALCAIPIYLIAKKIFNQSPWPLALAILWLINPFVHNITLFEFHLLSFGVFGILWMFYFYQTNKWWSFIIIGILTLLIREDLSLVVATFGILSLLDKKSFKWIIVPIISATLYFFFSLNLINEVSLDSGYKFLLYYSWLGSSLNEIIFNAITKPWLLIFKVISPGSIIISLALLLPLALSSLFKPKYLILSSLVFLQLVSGTSWQWLSVVLVTQYSSLLLPGIFIAGIHGIKKITDHKNYKLILLKHQNFLVLVTLTSLLSAISFGPLPGAMAELASKNKTTTLEKKELLAQIPPETSLASSYDSLGILSSRKQLASLNYAFLEKLQFGFSDYQLPAQTDYILLNTEDYLSYVIQYKNHQLYSNAFKAGVINWPLNLDNYGLIKTVDNWALLKKDYSSTDNLVTETNVTPKPKNESTENLLGIKFLGLTKKSSGQLELWWEKTALIEPDMAVTINFIKNKLIIKSKTLPLGYGLLKNNDENFFSMIYQPPAEIANQYDRIGIQLTKIEKGYIEVNKLRGLSPAFQYSTTSQELTILLNE